ncbi:MAG: 50S ribosomal protein L9 [Alphaproteobacteria bacterium]|nr:50S ribosomal protein L9 [Alphaproteobacteria bacterium]
MEVILLERVEQLGMLGSVVKVRPGYARNYLLPQKKALRATKANLEYFEKQRNQLEAHNAEMRSGAEADAKKISGINIVVIRQASEMGALYGSVSSRDIAEAAKEQGTKLERNKIDIGEPIKTLGLFKVKVKLHPEVIVDITVNVARTEEEAKVQAEKKAAPAQKAAPEAVAEPEAFVAEAGEETAAEEKPAKKARAPKKKAAKAEGEEEAVAG